MKAIVSTAGQFDMCTMTDPHRETPDAVLVRVEAISLNRGEMTMNWATGQAVGWDAAGTVLEESADGLGPTVGTRVVMWGFAGAWADRRVVSRHNLARVPDNVDAVTAAAVPVAGLTALRAIRGAHVGDGTRVAISGATGGVGHLAVQLAANAGAHVLAVTRQPRIATALAPAFRHPNVDVVDINEIELEDSLDVVLDTVGGPVLGFLAGKLAKRGTIVLIGAATGESAWIDAGQLMAKRIKIFSVDNPTPVGADLTEVLDLIATGKVNINVVELGTWDHLVSTSLSQLIGAGKTVLRVTK